MYNGLDVMGGGSILAGLILGAIATFIIDKNFRKGAGFALAGAILTFFGFMHGNAIGIGRTLPVSAAYAAIALVLFACSKYSGAMVVEPEHELSDEEEVSVAELEAAGA
jgi:AGZA family xanthine/uracil permease-like MFS transporter